MLAAIAMLSLLPPLWRHANLLNAPPWALGTIFLAAVQLVYAGWLLNAPDWATVRVQMIVSAALATIYAMVMTLAIITPPLRPMVFGLEERPLAAAWCGLMLVLLGIATWLCGRISAHWQLQMADDHHYLPVVERE